MTFSILGLESQKRTSQNAKLHAQTSSSLTHQTTRIGVLRGTQSKNLYSLSHRMESMLCGAVRKIIPIMDATVDQGEKEAE